MVLLFDFKNDFTPFYFIIATIEKHLEWKRRAKTRNSNLSINKRLCRVTHFIHNSSLVNNLWFTALDKYVWNPCQRLGRKRFIINLLKTSFDSIQFFNHSEAQWTYFSIFEKYSGVWLSFYTYYISHIEIGLFWAVITYFKSCSMAFNFWLKRNMK